jgi:hypothetical protein
MDRDDRQEQTILKVSLVRAPLSHLPPRGIPLQRREHGLAKYLFVATRTPPFFQNESTTRLLLKFDFTPEHDRDEESNIVPPVLLVLTIAIVTRTNSRAPRGKQERTIERW